MPFPQILGIELKVHSPAQDGVLLSRWSLFCLFPPSEWVAISFSRESSWPRDQIWVSCTGRQILYHLSHEGSPLNLNSIQFINFFLMFSVFCPVLRDLFISKSWRNYPSFSLRRCIFYLSHFHLQSIWSWLLCMVRVMILTSLFLWIPKALFIESATLSLLQFDVIFAINWVIIDVGSVSIFYSIMLFFLYCISTYTVYYHSLIVSWDDKS